MQKENLNADVFGPLAFDNSISKKSAAIKGVKNLVAGQADIILVPSVETGNGLVKMMVYFYGSLCCWSCYWWKGTGSNYK